MYCLSVCVVRCLAFVDCCLLLPLIVVCCCLLYVAGLCASLWIAGGRWCCVLCAAVVVCCCVMVVLCRLRCVVVV